MVSARRIAAAVLVAALSTVVELSVAVDPAQAAAASCSFGTGGPDAGTLCWLDMSGYDDTLARSAAGQSMSITLPGGEYTANFTVTSRPVPDTTYAPVAPRTAPLESRFAFGQTAYVGVAGDPILYSSPVTGTAGVTLALSGIEVVDSSGAPVSGYSFVIADAENNVNQESFTWTSDKPLNQLAVINPSAPAGCTLPLGGLGTTTVTCTGFGGGNGPYNEAVVSADTPSNIALTMKTFARSGVAFAVQTSRLTLAKSVAGRVNSSDSFDVQLTSPEDTVIGSASTGTGDAASTGGVTVLPRTNGAAYTLSEAGTPGSGTDLSAYTQSWSCSNAASSSDTVLPSGSGTSKQVSPQPGDDITCTITNAAPAVDTPIVDPEFGAALALTGLLGIAAALVLRRRRAHG